MTCHPFIHHGQMAVICGPDSFVNLEPFGSKVWCEYHAYLGPSFFRSELAITEIRVPSKKTWDAFQKWRDSLPGGKAANQRKAVEERKVK